MGFGEIIKGWIDGIATAVDATKVLLGLEGAKKDSNSHMRDKPVGATKQECTPNTSPTAHEAWTRATKSKIGKEMLQQFLDGHPGWNRQTAYTKTRIVMQSGTGKPEPYEVKAGAKFYKFVKSGGKPSETTPWWIDQEEYDELKGRDVKDIEQRLTLPAKSLSESKEYDVWFIEAKQACKTGVYWNIVAEKKFMFIKTYSGGAKQIIIPNHAGFSSPKLVGEGKESK
jgi:hypothetical protein